MQKVKDYASILDFSDDDFDDIRKHYPKGEDHWSLKKLGEWLGCSTTYIKHLAIMLGLVEGYTYEMFQRDRHEYYLRNRKAYIARTTPEKNHAYYERSKIKKKYERCID